VQLGIEPLQILASTPDVPGLAHHLTVGQHVSLEP
jgi:hypothetical protein